MKYTEDVGYAYENKIDNNAIEKKINTVLNILNEYAIFSDFKNVLVAGCGQGDEVKIIYNKLNANVVGIDLYVDDYGYCDGKKKMEIKKGSIECLEYNDMYFDFIFSYHVLEHVKNPQKVLRELKRVLKQDGCIFIGFPNRNRLLPGYLKTHIKISIIDIVKYNLNDYKKKIKGEFLNELGAHAGFSEKEFIELVCGDFNVLPVRSMWIKKNYSKYAFLINAFELLSVADYLYPSNYYILKHK